jgi:hypothetical protein
MKNAFEHLAQRIDAARTWQTLHLRAAIIHLPFLLLYVAVSLLSVHPQDLRSYFDSAEYLQYAESIVKSVATETNHVTSIWYGPGYPLLLVPSVVMGCGTVPAMLVSPFLLYAATVVFFLTARRFLTTTKSLLVSTFHALYLPYLAVLHGLWAEPLAIFLICGICGAVSLILSPERHSSFWHTVLAAVLLGYLALTKPLFGYVLTLLLCTSLAGLFLTRAAFWRKSLFVCAGAALVVLPYLAWTYKLTGKALYWSSAGGNQLYFMSTSYKGEYGSWKPDHRLKEGAKGYVATMEQTHYKVFDQFDGLTEVEKDDKVKEVAKANLRAHPLSYVRNVFYNASRLFFNFPYSYEFQKPTTLFYLIPNMFLVVGGVVSIGLAVYCGARLPSWMAWLGMLGVIYLGGTLLVSAYARMLLPVVPIIVLCEAYMLDRFVSIRFSSKESVLERDWATVGSPRSLER